ncbi:SRPBCC family protein [Candidatus Binatus sp.]|uniref:SRPBCC family protein n=1 Tax=Candidatus Binatus sp. TaxID=2811406 RepID=UPI002F947AD0
MKTVLKILAGVIVLAVVAIVGWRYYQMHRARQAGLLTENIAHDGDIWQADFTARIPAPEQTVFSAIRDIENLHNDQVKAVRVVSQSGNKKTVDMDIAGPGGQTITTELEFEYLPEQKKIVYHTVNNPLLDTQAVYQLGDEGASTFIDYHETTHLLQSLPVPDGIIKQVIRGIFVAQLETLKRSLNLKDGDGTDSGDDEP